MGGFAAGLLKRWRRNLPGGAVRVAGARVGIDQVDGFGAAEGPCGAAELLLKNTGKKTENDRRSRQISVPLPPRVKRETSGAPPECKVDRTASIRGERRGKDHSAAPRGMGELVNGCWAGAGTPREGLSRMISFCHLTCSVRHRVCLGKLYRRDP